MTLPHPPADRQKPPQSKFRTFAEAAVVIVCTLALGAFVIGLCVLLITGNNAGGRDVVSFWVAGRQIVHHADPYDGEAVRAMERSVGFKDTAQTLIMRNPPSALLLVVPLGLVGLRVGTLVWSLLLIASLIGSVHTLWAMHGRPPNKLHYLGYTFAPALTCILGGQTALFALVGLVLFLRLHRTRPLIAGLTLWLCALKPHLFLPFAAALLLWVVATRSYRLLSATLLALLASSLIAWRLDPQVWTQYGQMMRTSGIQNEFIPCLGIALRFAIDRNAMWLQYLLAVAGCVWAVVFYWRRRAAWDWMQDGAPLMLVSILVSPYGWLTDQTLVIPALLVGIYRASSREELGVLALASAAIEIAQIARPGMHSAFYLWTTPFWLAWYLYVTMKARCAGLPTQQCGTVPSVPSPSHS
ncbi:MAG: glycosyltransferase family 87 protein [Acidobacteriaceae bacterium]